MSKKYSWAWASKTTHIIEITAVAKLIVNNEKNIRTEDGNL